MRLRSGTLVGELAEELEELGEITIP